MAIRGVMSNGHSAWRTGGRSGLKIRSSEHERPASNLRRASVSGDALRFSNSRLGGLLGANDIIFNVLLPRGLIFLS